MNGIQYWPFPSTSTAFYRPADLQSLPAGPQHNGPLRTQSPIPLARSTPSPQCSSASDVEVVATAPAKKPRVKSADWTEDETHVVLEAWTPKFSKLRGASQREKIKI